MSDQKRGLVRRYDAILIAGLLASSGLAAIFFWILAIDRLPASDAAPNIPAPLIEPLNAANLFADQPLRFSGMAQSGDKVVLLNEGQPIYETVADDDGAWQIFLADGLPTGAYSLEVIAEDDNGSRSQAAPVSISIQAPLTPTLATLAPSVTDMLHPTATSTMTPSATATSSASPSLTLTSQPADTPSLEPSLTVEVVAQEPSLTATLLPVTDTPSTTPTIVTQAPNLTATQRPTRSATQRLSTEPAVVVEEPSVSPTKVILPTDTPAPRPSLTPTEAPPIPSSTPTQRPSVEPVIVAQDPSATLPAQPSTTTARPPSATPSRRAIAGPTLTFTPFGRSLSQPVEPSLNPTLAALTPSVTAFPMPTPVALALDSAPQIDSPPDGGQVAAGLVMVSGQSAAHTAVQIRDDQGMVLGITVSDTSGQWALTVPLTADVMLQAELVDNPRLQSDPIYLTISPVLQPQTGAANDHSKGKITTTLIALLLSAIGTAMIVAGHLLYTLKEMNNEA
ncbi:MAG: hypothetical protein H6673_13960 [Anaerolineales bacterium]|nr:hypothetical protein [Anaerolineales bacterium]